jgi:hypothetical protein
MKNVSRIEQRLIEQYWERVAHKPEPVKNEDLPAGSPMHYYCRYCGHHTMSIGEGDFMTRVERVCEGCQKLEDAGLTPVPDLKDLRVKEPW